MMGAATRLDGLAAREQNHCADPRTDGRNSVDYRSLDERLERSAQYLEQIVENHSSDVIGDDEHGPANHGRREHLEGPIEKAKNWNQHEQNEKAVRGGVAFKGISLKAGNAIGGDESSHHYDDEERAHVEAGDNGWVGVSVGLMRRDASAFDWGLVDHGCYWLSAGIAAVTGALGELSFPERSTAVTV